jgi:hypothetical protein
MGTSPSPQALVAKLQAAARAYGDLDQTVVREAAKVATATIKTGSPSRLRGVGKHGAALNVRTTFSSAGAAAVSGAQALVFGVGPWHLIENDTEAHQIPRQRRSATFEGVFGHAVIPGGSESPPHGKRGVRTKVWHRGTHGQHPFAKGVARADPLIGRVLDARATIVMRAIF